MERVKKAFYFILKLSILLILPGVFLYILPSLMVRKLGISYAAGMRIGEILAAIDVIILIRFVLKSIFGFFDRISENNLRKSTYIYYCSNCGRTEESRPLDRLCKACKHDMSLSNISLASWDKMSFTEREQQKRAWCGETKKNAEASSAAPVQVEDSVITTQMKEHNITSNAPLSNDNSLYCKYCGKQIEADSVFCRYCGKAVNAIPVSEKKAAKAPSSPSSRQASSAVAGNQAKDTESQTKKSASRSTNAASSHTNAQHTAKQPSPDNGNEFYKDIQELLSRDDITCKEDVCKAEYNKALGLLKNPTALKTNRAYDLMGNLAAQFDYIPAILWMGDFCENVRNEMQQAAYWYKKAADLGDGNGARNYADMVITGNGVNINPQEAIQYYSLAADKGIPEAAFVLGEFAHNAGDNANALTYYQKAADKGYSPAKIRIEQIKAKTQSASSNSKVNTSEQHAIYKEDIHIPLILDSPDSAYVPPVIKSGVTKVTHKGFGEGIITLDKAKKYATVKFDCGEKMFVFPDCFKNGFLEVKK